VNFLGWWVVRRLGMIAAAVVVVVVVVAAAGRQEKMTCRGNMCHHGDFVSVETSHVLFL